jgi:NADH dehydrogenase
MASTTERILITGANGHLGQLLLRRLGESEDRRVLVRSAVRSPRAAAAIAELDLPTDRFETVLVDYEESSSIRSVCEGCEGVVHLVGILKEGGGATYSAAHEVSCKILEHACRQTNSSRIVYLSILGASPDSTNACLASKGRAEEILVGGGTRTVVLRVPMVIGPDDHSSRALRAQANAPFVALTGGGRTIQQPIDAANVVDAILAALKIHIEKSCAVDLAGPETLSQRDLVSRAAALSHKSPVFVPIPLAVVRAFASVMTRFTANSPLTPAMLDVLQRDDRIDSRPGADLLGLHLTPVDEMLRRYVGTEARDA